MKKLFLTFTGLFFSLILTAQSASSKAVTTRVGILNGPSCIPVAKLIEDSTSVSDIELSFEKFPDPQALLPKLLKNEIDIGFLPINVAAKVYNSSSKAILCAGISGYGNLAIITKDKNIKNLSDLEGKTLYVAGQGSTPEYMLKFLLSKNKLIDKVIMDFSIPTASLAPALISDKIEYALVPEPFATIASIKDSSVFYAIDLQKEYKSLTKSDNYPLTCIVVNSRFAKEKPESVKTFLDQYKKSALWTVENPAQAGILCEKADLGLAPAIVTKTLPKSNYKYIPAADARKDIEAMLKIFMENDKSSIGGKLPDKDFYLK